MKKVTLAICYGLVTISTLLMVLSILFVYTPYLLPIFAVGMLGFIAGTMAIDNIQEW